MTVSDFIDGARFRGVVRRVPILCGMLMLIEGMDTYGVGYVSPALMQEYGIAPSTMGMIHTGTVVASLIGAVAIAPLADRFGRRPVLVLSSIMMGICTLLTASAGSELLLVIVRFLIGIGFGAAVPTAFSLVSDFAPTRHKSLIIMSTMAGIALGMALAGVIAALLIPLFGWRSLLLFSGVLSLIWTLLLFVTLPESPSFLLDRFPAADRTRELLMRLAKDRGEIGFPALRSGDNRTASNPLRETFSNGRLFGSLFLWVAMSAAYALEFFTSYWLPTVLLTTGADIFSAGLITALGKLGSISGAVLIGMTMDKLGAGRVLVYAYLLAAIAIIALGGLTSSATLSICLLVLMFFFLDGSFAGIQALTASTFPAHVRATGVGWVSGLARLFGGGAGTLLGGYLIENGLETHIIAIGMAIVMVIGALAIRLKAGSRVRFLGRPAG